MNQLMIAPLVLNVPTGKSCLPLVEIDRAKVETKRKSILLPKTQRSGAPCSYGQFGPNSLSFSAWEFCHAAKKTELTKTFTPQRADELALLFAHEHLDRFVWNPNNLRSVDGSSLWLEDFSGKYLAGRVGEALAYLTMTKIWGFVYWDRIASVYLRSTLHTSISHAEEAQVTQYTGKPTGESFALQPDFAFEKLDMTVALMEAKGSFVKPGNERPNAKGVLKHGLDQLKNWASLITPPPAKSIVIASFVREASDSCTDPSLILHVDPPAEKTPVIEPIEFQPDEIRRGNFGAWLIGMGFRSSGLALVERRIVKTSEVELPIVTLNGLKFAISVQGWRGNQNRFMLGPLSSVSLRLPWRARLKRWRPMGVTGVYALGLEVDTLKKVCEAITKPSQVVMKDLPNIDLGKQNEDPSSDDFCGSIMPDGSLMGIVSASIFDKIETMKFQL